MTRQQRAAVLAEIAAHHRAHHDDMAAIPGLPVRVRLPGVDGAWHAAVLFTADQCETAADNAERARTTPGGSL